MKSTVAQCIKLNADLKAALIGCDHTGAAERAENNTDVLSLYKHKHASGFSIRLCETLLFSRFEINTGFFYLFIYLTGLQIQWYICGN